MHRIERAVPGIVIGNCYCFTSFTITEGVVGIPSISEYSLTESQLCHVSPSSNTPEKIIIIIIIIMI